MKSSNYDSIIIGSGIGGLTLAALLSQRGDKVLVLEKHSLPGGYVTSFKRKGFTFDVGMHLLLGVTPGDISWEILSICQVSDKIEVIRPEEFMRCIYPDMEMSIPQCAFEEYQRRLVEKFPHDRDGISKVFETLRKYSEEVHALLYSAKLPVLFELLIFPYRYPTLIGWRGKTVGDLLEVIKDKKAWRFILPTWNFYGLPPSKLALGVFGIGWPIYSLYGGYYIKGGAQTFSDAFVESIREMGGEVKLRTPAKKILIEKNRAHGVETEAGEKYYAKNIISNADLRSTVLGMAGEEHFPQKYLDRVRREMPSISAFQIYLGIDAPISEFGINDYMMIISDGCDYDLQFNEAEKGRHEKLDFYVTIYSNLDENAAPTGKGTLVISVMSGYDYWKNLSKEEYKRKKKEVADFFIKKLEERLMPGISKHIEVCEAATPLTMERYTGNYKGAIYGGAKIVEQVILSKIPQITPVNNLYLVGHWTFPGAGITTVMKSAYILFKKHIR